MLGGPIVRKNDKKEVFGLDSPDALGSTVEPYASPSYLLDDDDDIESELDPGILKHPGKPSNISLFSLLQFLHTGS